MRTNERWRDAQACPATSEEMFAASLLVHYTPLGLLPLVTHKCLIFVMRKRHDCSKLHPTPNLDIDLSVIPLPAMSPPLTLHMRKLKTTRSG